ncbi:uncharacterized protein LOC117643493 [Thrips palmi]|uniref:Uncharacterized protein LOC117643493 n=1 Tax=Thrips palmi TaxID=161013 RepID=A0A6P8YF11_THRPL|nr:uncharacterized protein LOC117643493 [Thrips palmi]
MIPDETIRLLGWVAAGIPPDHLANLSLSEIDTVATLGAFHNLSTEQVGKVFSLAAAKRDRMLRCSKWQLSTLAESVRMQWSAKEPEDLSHLDLAALNHILCGFNASDIGRIHADAYKEAASSLSLLRCPGMPGAVPLPGAGDGSTPGVVMVPGVDPGGGTLPVRALALLAESGDAFGDPSGWGASTAFQQTLKKPALLVHSQSNEIITDFMAGSNP